MSLGFLIGARGGPARPWIAVTTVSPPQGAWYVPERLLDPQPRHRLRLRTDTVGSLMIAFDLGAPAESVTHVALISTTLAAGVMLVAGSPTHPTAGDGAGFNSGAIALASLAEPQSGSIVVPVTSAQPSQFLRVELAGQEVEAFVDLGLIVCGQAVAPARTLQFGTASGRLDAGLRDVAVGTGASFGRAGARPRFLEFELAHTRAETIPAGTAPTLTDRLRVAAADQHDVLVMPNVADAAAIASRRAIWGRCEAVGGDVWERFDVARTRWRVVERI